MYSKLGKLSTGSVGNIIHEIQTYCPVKKTCSKCDQIIYSASTEFSLPIGNEVHKQWWLGLRGGGSGSGRSAILSFLSMILRFNISLRNIHKDLTSVLYLFCVIPDYLMAVQSFLLLCFSN